VPRFVGCRDGSEVKCACSASGATHGLKSAVSNVHITFERSGGVVGRMVRTNVDSSKLAPEEAQHLAQLVEDSGFFQLPATVQPPAQGGADRFQYRLTIDDGGRQHSVQMREDAVPPPARPLVDWLTRQGRRSQGP